MTDYRGPAFVGLHTLQLRSCEMMSGDADVIATLQHKAAYYWTCLVSLILTGHWVCALSITAQSVSHSMSHLHISVETVLFHFLLIYVCTSMMSRGYGQ